MSPVLMLAAALASSAAPETYRIGGTVVNAVTGAALERVRVSIAPTSERTRLSYANTGAGGRFLFDKLPVGKWQLAAERRGYLPQTFGQPPSLGAAGIAIVTGSAESTEHLVFRLYPPAMITGKVTDSAGEPVERALVQVLSWATIGGRRQVRAVRSGWTTDDGVYAIGWLPAGSYFITVTGEPWYAGRVAKDFRAMTFGPQSAGPMLVRPGEEATADFTLTAAPAVSLTLTGRGQPVRLRLSSEGVQGAPIWHGFSDSALAAHQFHLVPGRYTAWFWSGSDEQPSVQTIELPARDTVLELAPDPPAYVEATIELQGIASAVPTSLGLALVSEDGSRGVPRMIPPFGAVKYPPVLPGRYRLVLMGPAARDAYIDRVSAEGARLTKGLLEFAAGATVRLHVAVSGQGGRVEGKVYRAGRPFPGALVVLAPRADTGNPADYRGFVSDSDGSFEYSTVKPGEYTIFLVEEGSQFEYANPAAVAPYLESGRPVRVEPEGAVNLRLELPAPRPTG